MNHYIKRNLHFLYKMKSIIKILILVYILINFISFGSCVPLDSSKKINDLVEDYGYPFMRHKVQTEDGYILEIHNVPAGRNESTTGFKKHKPVALLMHGILESSVDWFTTGPNISLAFLLADQGYDVWLGNNRGNTFSKNHTKYLETSYGFWDFSWHELGIYDLPAMIDYILKATGESKLFYIGYSQGTTQFFVMASLKPEYNDKIRLAVTLAPVAYLGYTSGIIGLLGKTLTIPVATFFNDVGHVEIMPASSLSRLVSKILCEDIKITQTLCYSAVCLIAGVTNNLVGPMTPERMILLKKLLPYFPAGCSTKQLLHYGFGIQNPETFRQYDYGSIDNLKTYNSIIPPDYPLENIKAPIAVYYGTTDVLADPLDVELLLKKLKNVVQVSHSNGTLNHLAFNYGSNIRQDIYLNILTVMEKF